MASQTQIKIRYGLIMQGVLARALTGAGYTYDETPTYDEDSEVPDFLIPDADNPEFMLEVHQTDARDHFRMKTLRSLTAVAEAKAFFGTDIVSVNVLFGDPDAELPEANLRAMCGIFDVNVLLQRDASETERAMLRELETAALNLAEDTSVATCNAAEQLATSNPTAVVAMGRIMVHALSTGTIQESLVPMWEEEKARRDALGAPPEPGESTFYKKNMVRSLFFQDADFQAMVDTTNADEWPESAKEQIVRTGIAEKIEEIDGDHLIVDEGYRLFLGDHDAPRLRGLCKDILDGNDAMKWFFEDIRDKQRRETMGATLELLLDKGRDFVEEAVYKSIVNGDSGVVPHTRAWIADLLPLLLGKSHNFFNGLMYRDLRYPLSVANPYPNIVIRSPRVLQNHSTAEIVSSLLCNLIWEQAELENVDFSKINSSEIADQLLNFRLAAAIKLKKVDPLILVIKAICQELNLDFEELRIRSIYSEFSDDPQLGVFRFFKFRNNSGISVVCNALAAYENPTDKAKEWAARRLAISYGLEDGFAVRQPDVHSIFVIDGVWASKDVKRLFSSGWGHIVRLPNLEQALRDIFLIPSS